MHFCVGTNTVSDRIRPLFGMDWLEQVVDVFEVNYVSAPMDTDVLKIRAMLLPEG